MRTRVFCAGTLIALATVFVSMAVFACSCAPLPDVATALDRADAVFAGRVIGLELVPRYNEDPTVSFLTEDLIVRLVASSCWKGDVELETVFYTAFTCCVCGFPFAIGESYIIYAIKDGDSLRTSMCTRTRLLVDASEDLVILGDLRPVSLQSREVADPLTPCP